MKTRDRKNIAATITQYRLDTVRMSYSSEALPNILKLREEISAKWQVKMLCKVMGKVPFLLSFIGPSSHSVPNGQLEVVDGSEIDNTFLVDFNYCASLRPLTTATKMWKLSS